MEIRATEKGTYWKAIHEQRERYCDRFSKNIQAFLIAIQLYSFTLLFLFGLYKMVAYNGMQRHCRNSKMASYIITEMWKYMHLSALRIPEQQRDYEKTFHMKKTNLLWGCGLIIHPAMKQKPSLIIGEVMAITTSLNFPSSGDFEPQKVKTRVLVLVSIIRYLA